MTPERLLALYYRVAEAPDAGPRLRRFVLDITVRGKLVEQDPADEPASDLLKRISAEKARMVKAREIRKQRPAAPIREIPFEVPPTWQWTQIAELGAMSPRNDYPDSLEASIHLETSVGGCVRSRFKVPYIPCSRLLRL